ncbi:hypothetical protein [Stratiformator vulcanicus]|uniref:Uncharacterized protein n=1 Tax=Stratiformator vulcanicus TaxID=2527980 RepID=A0A517QZP7_9PLAN|nr:hypothetical protein [Stratiformator vulcanicus]QDT37088.1 hypothetical protein Pan189_14560 [Stratiformator vulcanicus]
MRLTLRTLLAYLDDLLAPNETKEIGKKLAESPKAEELAERIRQSVRKRRLTFPGDESPALLDPNTVAAYLDSTLVPEEVAEVERICMESDVHLAEVAACHQVLALVLGQPVEITDQSRRRMYELATPNGPSDDHAATPAEPAPSAPLRSKPTAPASQASELVASMPRKIPTWRRALPYGVLAALAVGWVALIWFDPGIFPSAGFDPIAMTNTGSNDDADTSDSTNGSGVDTDDESPSDSTADSDASGASDADSDLGEGSPPDESGSMEVASPDSSPSGDLPNLPLDAEPPDEIDNPLTGSEPPVQFDVPSTPPTEVASTSGPPVESPVPSRGEPDTPGADSPSPLSSPKPLNFVFRPIPNGYPILLKKPGEEQWVPITDQAVPIGSFVTAIKPFHDEFAIDGSTLRMELLGGTAIRTYQVAAETKSVPAIELVRGRMLISSDSPNPIDSAGSSAESTAATPNDTVIPAAIELTVAEKTCRLEFLEGRGKIAVEAAPIHPNGKPTPGVNLTVPEFQPRINAAVYVIDGPVRFAEADGNVKTLRAGEHVVLERVKTLGTPDAPGDNQVITMPEWVENGRSSQFALDQTEPVLDALSTGQVAAISLPPLLSDRRPYISAWAADALGLIGAIDPLVRTLVDAPHVETVTEAAHEIQVNLALDEAASEVLTETAASILPPNDADVLVSVLWGISPEVARDEAASLQFLEALEHDRVAVRQIAFAHLLELTGQRLSYRETASLSARTTAVRRWRDYVTRQGGLLPKQPANSPADAEDSSTAD